MKQLTRKQAFFVNEYLKDFNATRAARDAGYSQKTAYSIGQENLRKPEIAKMIKSYAKERAVEANLTVEKILGSLEQLRSDALKCGNLSVALRAIELQGKYLGMFTQKNDISIKNETSSSKLSEEQYLKIARRIIKKSAKDS
ncbi:MAG: terminase small subunit [Bacteriovoracaceae bacterium]|nr:terminase small subunit [Bacteriovoracaceae bacterium]